tara:strand:- start:200 stop:373 length:174 start_codon:yes stop_codon:yes gene_type:complete
MKTGDKVMIKPEWQDKGDDSITFTVVEVKGDRLLIKAELGLPINPTSTVLINMVEVV